MEGERINNSVTVESMITASYCPTDLFKPLCRASRMKSEVSPGNLLLKDNETAERSVARCHLQGTSRGSLSVWKQCGVNRPSGSTFISSCIVYLQTACTWTAVSSLALPSPAPSRVITTFRLSKQTLRHCRPKGAF